MDVDKGNKVYINGSDNHKDKTVKKSPPPKNLNKLIGYLTSCAKQGFI